MKIRREMSVRELLHGHGDTSAAGAAGDIIVRGLTLDSRRLKADDAFVALAGANAHGITFAPAASARGAAVILAEKPTTAATVPDVVLRPGIGIRDSVKSKPLRSYGSTICAIGLARLRRASSANPRVR